MSKVRFLLADAAIDTTDATANEVIPLLDTLWLLLLLLLLLLLTTFLIRVWFLPTVYDQLYNGVYVPFDRACKPVWPALNAMREARE
jgi:hypothetical protein